MVGVFRHRHHSREVLAPLEGHSVVRVVVRTDGIFVMPLASEVAKRERIDRLKAKLASGELILSASIAHGGGVLRTRRMLAWPKLVWTWIWPCSVRSRRTTLNSLCAVTMPRPIRRCLCARRSRNWFMDTMNRSRGLKCSKWPCSGASRAGKSKRGLALMEQHPEVGHQACSSCRFKAQPAAVVLENVEDYSVSASAQILRSQLRDMGYQVREHVLPEGLRALGKPGSLGSGGHDRWSSSDRCTSSAHRKR